MNGLEKDSGNARVAGWYVILRTDGTSEVIYCESVPEIRQAIGAENLSSVPVDFTWLTSPFGRRSVRLLVDDEGKMREKAKNMLATEMYDNLREEIVGDAAVGMLNQSGRDICGFITVEEAERVAKLIRKMYETFECKEND